MTRTLGALIASAWLLGASLQGQQTAVFRSSVDVVALPVSVRDGNRPVSGLTSADFEVLDNLVRQEITSTVVEGLPVDVTLVLDASGSVTGAALAQLKSDVQQMGDLLQPNDRVRLLTFAEQVHDVFGLQPGGARLPVDRITAGGDTSFYNALAAALVAFPSLDRPQFVFAMTDGLDSESFLDADRVAALAGFSTASLYIALVPSVDTVEHVELSPDERRGTSMGSRSLGSYVGGPNRSALRRATEKTGGELYANPAEKTLPAIFARVLDDFRTSYVVRYTPHNVPRAGWHDVIVRTKNRKYTVRTRQGYDGGL
jgi:VWFA-related protein